MAMRYRRVDRDQLFLLPPSMRDWLPAGHLALLVEEVVEQMDTSRLHAQSRLGGVGRAGYDPDMLFALLVYAYAEGVLSSRKIESRCHTDVAFRYLCAQDTPDHTVIARFRRSHAQALTDLLTEVLIVAVKLGMGRFGHVAIDGTKIAANAAKDANATVGKLRELAAELVEQGVAADDADDDEHGPDNHGGHLSPGLHDRTHRRQRIAQALANAQTRAEDDDAAHTKAEAKLAAAQARLAEQLAQGHAAHAAWQARKDTDGISPPGRKPGPVENRRGVKRAQQAVDRAEAKIAALAHAATDPNKQPRANLTDPQSRLLPTKDGWIQGYNCQLAASDDQLIIAADIHDSPHDAAALPAMLTQATTRLKTVAQATGKKLRIDLATADAGYDTDTNLTTEGPDRLIAQANRHTAARQAKTDPTTGPPPPDATPRQQMSHRLRTPEGRQAYKRRSTTIEPVNGHVKDRGGLRQFRLRGITGAKTELFYAAIAHNIRKMHTFLHRPTPATT